MGKRPDIPVIGYVFPISGEIYYLTSVKVPASTQTFPCRVPIEDTL